MHKELYKSANDKIPTDDVKTRVVEKVNSQSSSKKQFSYAKVAALAACFVITVGAVGVYESQLARKTPVHEAIASEEIVGTISAPEGTMAPEPKAAEPKQEPKQKSIQEPEKQADAIVTQNPVRRSRVYAVPEVQEAQEVQAAQEEQEATIAVAASLEDPQIPAESGNIITPNENMPNQDSPMMVRYIEEENTPVSVDDYYKYLGKDVGSAVNLPDAFVNETPREQNLTLEGEEVEDEWTFYFTDNENSVFVTTTKDTKKIQDFLNDPQYEKSTVAGNEVIVFEKGAERDAYFISEDIGYTVKVHGVSDEDFENVIVSLTE